MSWFLNASLSSWRDFINSSYPKRSKTSDGTIGDTAHAASVSEHNPDRDGSVDAYDCDVNLLGSTDPDGNAAEDAAMESLKREFERQPFAQLWIHNGKIANRDIGNWKVRDYSGKNKHNHHIHFQSKPSAEKQTYKGRRTDRIVDAVNTSSTTSVPVKPAVISKPAPPKTSKPSVVKSSAPAFPPVAGGAYSIKNGSVYRKGVLLAQQQLRARGWKVDTDGYFGPGTEKIIEQFQKEKKLTVDGKLGPLTWRAIFTAPL